MELSIVHKTRLHRLYLKLKILLIVYLRSVRVEIGRGRGEVSTHGADERLGIRVGRQVILTPKRINNLLGIGH